MRQVTRMMLLVALSALVAGCGGSDKEQARTPDATPAPTVAEPTATETAVEPAGTPDPASTKRPDTDGDGTPDPQTFRGKQGDSFTLVGQPSYKKAAKNAVQVTVLSVKGPFSGFDLDAGRELIGLEVRFRGVGSKPYSDPQPSGELTLSSGETGKPTSLITSGANPCDNPSLKLTKGKTVTECLAFEVNKNDKPRIFQYAADSGYGDTGVWKLK